MSQARTMVAGIAIGKAYSGVMSHLIVLLFYYCTIIYTYCQVSRKPLFCYNFQHVTTNSRGY
jgi:hypothetical protein